MTIMKKIGLCFMAIALVFVVIACNQSGQNTSSQEAERLMNRAYKARDYHDLLRLADSLETSGELSQAKAFYWRGYASDKLRQKRMAEFYWKTSLLAADKSKDYVTYAQSSSRLANLLTVRGEFESALKMAMPAAEKLEEAKCDTTSDYVNLLIYIGCCQAGLGKSGSATADGFDRAYQKHLDNIKKERSDAVYKDAIAGLINIAVACLETQNYQDALKWTSHFGELLNEYQQRPDILSEYLDKQMARFKIYQAEAYEGLGKSAEASQTYESFQNTMYSKTTEGRILANRYLMTASRWDEAAENYKGLNEHLNTQLGGYTIENIKELLLKKYRTNRQAGRRDSAAAVGMEICDSLEKAFALSDRLDAEEQSIVVKKVEEMALRENEAKAQRQYMLFGLIGLLVVGLVAFMIWRHRAAVKLEQSHENLKTAYGQLEEATSAREREETESRLVSNIRQVTLPGELPQHQRVKLEASLIPGRHSGTDFCDVLLRDEQLIFCIGQVEGEGVATAVTMAMSLAQFRSAAALESSPQRILAAIKGSDVRGESMQRLSIFVGVLDIASSHLRYCNDGLPTPLLLDGEVKQLLSSENVSEVELKPATTLFFFTDGILKVENGTQKSYSEKALRGAALQAMKLDATPKAFTEKMLGAVRTFMDNTEQKYDWTTLAIHLMA